MGRPPSCHCHCVEESSSSSSSSDGSIGSISECEICGSSGAPAYYEFKLSGVADEDCSVANACLQFNNTIILSHRSRYQSSTPPRITPGGSQVNPETGCFWEVDPSLNPALNWVCCPGGAARWPWIELNTTYTTGGTTYRFVQFDLLANSGCAAPTDVTVRYGIPENDFQCMKTNNLTLIYENGVGACDWPATATLEPM